ncbi:MAG: hypothetical protein QOC58_2189, partial [Mycobacterium sp.]|nr:hypothetical protein [Mycobacterium sp.]
MATDFGYLRSPGTGSRVPTSHRKKAVRSRLGTAGSPAAGTSGSNRELSRRRFLGALAAATVAGVGAARLVVDPQPRTFAQTPAPNAVTSGPTAPAALLPPPPPGARIPLPGGGALMKIPGDGDLLALTVDDGVNSEVVRAYTQFAKDTGVRLTFFVNGIYKSWTENLDTL